MTVIPRKRACLAAPTQDFSPSRAVYGEDAQLASALAAEAQADSDLNTLEAQNVVLEERMHQTAETAYAMQAESLRRKRRRLQRDWEELQREGDEADAADEAARARTVAECVSVMTDVERQRGVAAAKCKTRRRQQLQQYEAQLTALMSE